MKTIDLNISDKELKKEINKRVKATLQYERKLAKQDTFTGRFIKAHLIKWGLL